MYTLCMALTSFLCLCAVKKLLTHWCPFVNIFRTNGQANASCIRPHVWKEEEGVQSRKSIL